MIQALQDNYSYLLIDKERKVAAAVDAVEPAKVLAAAKEEGVAVESVLTTHNHWDHAGGNEEMKKMLMKDVPFIAGKGEDVPEQTKEVSEVASASCSHFVLDDHRSVSRVYVHVDERGVKIL